MPCGWFGRALRTPPPGGLPLVALPRSYKFGAFASNQLRWSIKPYQTIHQTPHKAGVLICRVAGLGGRFALRRLTASLWSLFLAPINSELGRQTSFAGRSSLTKPYTKPRTRRGLVYGGCGWDRTSDPYDVNVVLIPLSYTPVLSFGAYLIILYFLFWQELFYIPT